MAGAVGILDTAEHSVSCLILLILPEPASTLSSPGAKAALAAQ